jgi:hypothetical protein
MDRLSTVSRLPADEAAARHDDRPSRGAVMPTLVVGTWARGPRVRWRYAVGSAVVLGLLAHALVATLRHPPVTTPVSHSHASNSFILAFNWVFCGKYSSWSPRYAPGLAGLLETRPTLDQPIASIPEVLAGSLETYCGSVSTPFIHAENSMMLLDAAFMFAAPNGTIRDLDRAMRWLQWLMIVPFVAVALRGGASLLLGFGIWFAGALTISLLNDAISCSAYGFLAPATAALAGIVAAANDRIARGRAGSAIVAGLAVGLAAAFVINLRTSYIPLVGASLAIGALCAMRGLGREALARAPLLLGGCVVAWAGFHLALIAPIHAAGASNHASTEHHFFHPLVLGLANPPNDLAREEGIEWADETGLTLAVRADPGLAGVDSLWSVPMPRYEAALRAYYVGLWRHRTRDMLNVYWLKWVASTEQLFSFIAENLPEPLRAIGIAAGTVLRNGVGFSLGFLLVGTFAVARCREATMAATTLVAITCAFLVLLGLESAIILSGFYLSHQSALLFFTLTAALAVVQACVHGLVAVARRVRGE